MRVGPKLTVAVVLAASLAGAARARADGPPVEVLELGGGVTLELVRVAPGSFVQGSPPNELERGDDEGSRTVTISAEHLVGRTPVTRGQFARFVEETGYQTEAERGASGGFGWDGKQLTQKPEYTWRTPGFAQDDAHPVVLVTWDDAVAFTRWLSERTGREVRLPTEAEWEYAARAGTTTAWYGATDAAGALELGWFRENAGDGTRPVGQKRANALGLFDVSGNVWEWCLDWYGPYAFGAATDPRVDVAPAGDEARRVLRGGSWMKSAKSGRSAARYRNTPGSRNADNGFRVVMTAGAAAAAADVVPPGERPAGTEPYATGRPETSYFGWLDFEALPIAIMAAIAVIVLSLRKGKKARTSIGEDGFEIRAEVPDGTTVSWMAVVDGRPERGSIEIYGGQTFVYTGARPTIAEASIAAAAAAGAKAAGAKTSAKTSAKDKRRAKGASDDDDDDTWSSTTRSDDPPFGGWPSAY